MKFEVGFIGLGVMGSAMAGHILRGGHQLTIYNRTASKTENLKAEGAKVASSPKELAQSADLIFICAGDGASVKEIIFGDSKGSTTALTAGLRPGAIIVDHSTIASTEAQDLAKNLAGLGFKFLDAPVTGGDIGAKNGTLTIMVGGDADALQKVTPVLNLYAKKVCRIGESGFGQKMKAVNQIGAVGKMAVVTEMLQFAQAQGLDLGMTVETLAGGAANSFALGFFGPKIINGDFKPGFSVKHSKKDIGIVLSQAQGLDLPITNVTFKGLERAEKQGLSEAGNHVLFNLKEDK